MSSFDRRLPSSAMLGVLVLALSSGAASCTSHDAGGAESIGRTAQALPPDTKVLYLWFADGKTPSPNPHNCKPDTTPTFAFNDDYKKQVKAQVDVLYQDLNIVTTTKQPKIPSYFLSNISSNVWCTPIIGAFPPNIGGWAADYACSGADHGVSYAFCKASEPVSLCASTIAQEQAHNVGLDHTSDTSDVMYPLQSGGQKAFQDKTNSKAQGAQCPGTTQNSYQLIKERLGAWPGGPKPNLDDDGTTQTGDVDAATAQAASSASDDGGSSNTNDDTTNDDNGSADQDPPVPKGGCSTASRGPWRASAEALLLVASAWAWRRRRAVSASVHRG
jgi:hypothetical protein